MNGMNVASMFEGRVEVGNLPDALLAAGVHAFTTQDACAIARVKPDSARPALARLIKKKLAFSPARGLYIPIPPEYRSWGVVPAAWFVDALMAHLGRAYYVGYLSAAEIHGASHQRPQVFQLVVDRDVRDRGFGRVRLRFITNREIADLPTVRVNTPTGTMAVSIPELTALDLANRPEHGGALHNVATLAVALARDGKLDDATLSQLAGRFPATASRRLGWIIEEYTPLRLHMLAEAASSAADAPSKLDQHAARRGRVDPRWRVRVNAAMEADP